MLINLEEDSMNSYRIIKRLIDFFLSIVLLIPAIPICLIGAILIMLETKGNPLYTQERVGLNGEKFTIYKLRSMYSDAEKDGHKWAEKEDSRITKVGSIIRKTRIDELPQLINIIRGEMAIIGPVQKDLNLLRNF